jgi:hypothetical protein
MTKAARERLARLLGGEEAAAFSGQVSLPADVLSLEVEGVGPIRLPVKPAQAKKMCVVASPAKFGYREGRSSIPLSTTGVEHAPMWSSLYDSEPRWLANALMRASLPCAEDIERGWSTPR